MNKLTVWLILSIADAHDNSGAGSAPTPSPDLPYMEIMRTGEDGFACTRFPMMMEVWGKIHVVSEFTKEAGDHCLIKGGGQGGHSTGRIALKTSTDGKQWSNATFLPRGNTAYGRDPTLLYVPTTDQLCVFFNAAASKDSNGVGELHGQCKSRDGNWDEPKSLTPHLDSQCAGFIQGRPVGVVLSNGSLLITSWKSYYGADPSRTQICIIGSDDNGKSWSRIALLSNMSEAALILLPNNRIYLNARHTGQEHGKPPYGRVTGYSSDGNHWDLEYNSKHSPPDTMAPSPTSLLQLQSGALLMVLPTKGYHEAMTVFASFDDGKSWPWTLLVSKGLCYHPTLVTIPNDKDHVGVAWEAEAPGSNCTGSCAVRFVSFRVPQPNSTAFSTSLIV